MSHAPNIPLYPMISIDARFCWFCGFFHNIFGFFSDPSDAFRGCSSFKRMPWGRAGHGLLENSQTKCRFEWEDHIKIVGAGVYIYIYIYTEVVHIFESWAGETATQDWIPSGHLREYRVRVFLIRSELYDYNINFTNHTAFKQSRTLWGVLITESPWCSWLYTLW